MTDEKAGALNTVQVLHQEYLRCCGEVERLLTQNEKVLQFGTLVSGGLLYGSFVKEVLLLHLLVPITLVGLFLYLVNVHEFAMAQRGYIVHLERTLNGMLGEAVLRWETEFAEKKVHYRGTTNALVCMGSIVCLAASVTSFYKAWGMIRQDYGPSAVFMGALGGYGVLLLGLLVFAVMQVTRLGALRQSVESDIQKTPPIEYGVKPPAPQEHEPLSPSALDGGTNTGP